MRIAKIAIILLLISANFVFGGREDDYNFARKLFDDGYYDLAAEQYAKFIEDYPDDSRLSFAHYMCGQALKELGNWEGARASFLKTALSYPDSKYAAEAFYLAAYCVEYQGKMKDAARGYLIISDYYPNSDFAPRGMFRAGLIYRKLNDTGEAWSVFERIIAIYPNSEAAASAYFNMADIAENRGNDQDALLKYRLAAQISTDETISSESFIRRGMIYYRLGDWDLAEKEIAKVKSPPELVIKTQMLQGVWLQWRGDFHGAEEILLEVLKKSQQDSLNSLTLFYLGDNYYQQQEYVNAIEFYNKAFDSDSLYLRKGITYLKLDDLPNALQSFLKVLKMDGDPQNKIYALEQLSELYKTGIESASVSNLLLSYFEEIKNLPNWDRLASGIGEIAFYEENYDTAEKYFNLLTGSNSAYADDSGYFIARIAEIRSDTLNAINLYSDFIDSYPGSEYIKDSSSRKKTLESRLPKDNLLQEIALLTSASIDIKTRGGMALKWGELYYTGFKDFMKACEQLGLALGSGELTEEENIYAYELMAKSLKERLGNEPGLADSTRKTMSAYISMGKTGPASGEFSLYILRQRLSVVNNSSESERIYLNGLADILTKYPEDNVIPEILLEMCLVSLKLNYPDKVVSYGTQLQNRFKDSVYYKDMLIVRSKAYMTLKDPVKAAMDLDEYITGFAEGGDLFFALKTRALLERDIKKRIERLKEIVGNYYYHSEVNALREMIGDLHLQQQDYAEALEYYSSIEEESSVFVNIGDGYDIGYKLGLVYYKTGDLSKAQDYFLDYTVRNPDGEHWVEALFALAEISEIQGKAPAALKFYQNLISNSKDNNVNTSAFERMAKVYYRIGNYSEGRKLYQSLAEDVDDRKLKMEFEAQAVIGLYKQDLLENARAEAIAFAKKYGVSSDLPLYQAKFYLEKGKSQGRQKNFSEALKTLKYALKKYRSTPIIPSVKYEVGKIQLITNNFDEALDILTELVEEHPADEIIPAVYISLGTFYYRQRQMQNALLAFQKVLDDSQAVEYHPTALNNLEMTYKDLGLYEAALSMVNRYLEKYPFADDVLLKKVNAAQILVLLREYDRAIEKLKDLLPQVTQELRLEVQFYLGEAYFKKGDFQQALLEYMKVKYLDPGTGLDWAVTALYNTGQSYEKLGNYDSAREIYLEIIQKYGTNSDYGRGAQLRIDFIGQKERQ